MLMCFFVLQDDIIIDWSQLHFGMKERDPLGLVPFYGKENPHSKCDSHQKIEIS